MGKFFYMKETERMGKGFFEQLPHRKAFRSPSCLTIDDDCCNFNIDIIKNKRTAAADIRLPSSASMVSRVIPMTL